jgi:hypothetical protein
MTEKKRLQDKLRVLAHKKGTAPAYQRELIQREINNTRRLLRDTYGRDTVEKTKEFVFPAVLLGGFLTALYLWVNRGGNDGQTTISSLDL